MHRDRIILAPPERRELKRRARSRTIRQEDARRAQLILLLASGATWVSIQARLDCTPAFINKWSKRFREGRLPALTSRKAKGNPPTVLTPEMEAKILAVTRTPPPDGSTHWSTRRLGKHLGVSHTVVHRAWTRANPRPHRLERYLASNDPDFEKKAADVIGLYLNPPENAVVFSVDEKTAIQALDRTVPVLPMSPGRAERHGFEYYRHGTRSLIAALDTQTGEVRGKTPSRIGGEPLLAFLKEIVASQPPDKQIHVIADNLSSHKTKRIKAFIEANPNFHMHYTPTYSSWLNQIELWFSKLKRDVLARGVFTSTADLERKILRFIREHNKRAKPFTWTYNDVRRRIAIKHANTVH